MVSLWNVLQILAPILAPILTLMLVTIGRVIWNHERRMRELERGITRHGRSLYGDDRDSQQRGIAQDVYEMSERMETLHKDVRSLQSQVTRLEEKLNENSNDD